MKTVLLFASVVSALSLSAQTVTPVRDKANTAQAKKMVFQQWDDWEPTPETGFLGIPKNPAGFLYWKVIHGSYYNGQDRRPYRVGGPFEQNYASLSLQQEDDQRIRDSMQKVMETNVATYVSMSGGAADVAWNMYFGKQFERLFGEIPSRMLSIHIRYPVAYDKMLQSRHYKEYLEYLDLTQDRVKAIHDSFVDRGERIVTYLNIQKEIEHRNEVMNEMINTYIRLTKLPSVVEVKGAKKMKVIRTNDAGIVKDILVNFNF